MRRLLLPVLLAAAFGLPALFLVASGRAAVSPQSEQAEEAPRRPAKAAGIPGATEFEFVLPYGYVDREGVLHREGTMRLARVADEILPLKDPRVQANPAYFIVLLLSRVVTRLGTLRTINAGVIEELVAGDMAYLQEFYRRINGTAGGAAIKATCPKCGTSFTIQPGSPG